MSSHVPIAMPPGQPRQDHSELTVPNRLLDVGDLVGGSFRTLRAAPRLFLLLPVLTGIVLAAVALPLMAIAIAAGLFGAREDGGSAAAALLGVVMLAVAALALYVSIRLTGAIIIGAYRVALGERPTMGEAWRESSGIVWRLVALAVLLYALFVAGLVVVVGLLAGLRSANQTLGIITIVVAVPACLVALAYLGVRLSFAFPVIAIEKSGPIAAVRRSLTLTKGHWWSTFGRFALLILLAIPVSGVTSTMTAPLLSSLESSSGAATAAFGIGAALTALVAILLNYLYQIYAYIYHTLMYLDLRRRESLPPVPGYAPPVTAPGYPYEAAPPTSQPYGSQPPTSQPPTSQPYGSQPYGSQSEASGPYGAAPTWGGQPYPDGPATGSPGDLNSGDIGTGDIDPGQRPG